MILVERNRSSLNGRRSHFFLENAALNSIVKCHVLINCRLIGGKDNKFEEKGGGDLLGIQLATNESVVLLTCEKSMFVAVSTRSEIIS
jgi:hypothetical protein